MPQKSPPLKIPLTVNMHIEAFSGGSITRLESGSKNLVYAQYADGRWYATQRPGINQVEDASVIPGKNNGRGCYFWDAISDLYIVNDDTVFKTSYSGVTMDISSGMERVFMIECGDYLVIIDAENNEGWTISSGASTTIAAISDTNFPPNQTPALQLARGGAVLDGKLYVMTTQGDIYESDIEDPTSWNGLSFTNAEIAPDGGVHLARHYSQLVAFGSRTVQFFEDTQNPVGSTLSARTDIQFDVGAVDTDSVWKVGENLYFVGQDNAGNMGVYVIENFQLSKVSTPDIDSFITTAVTQDGVSLLGCGLSSGGREFYVLSAFVIADTPGTETLLADPDTDALLVDPETGAILVDIGEITRGISARESLVFSEVNQWWGNWDLQIPPVDHFPLMGWVQTTKQARAGEGIMANGDLITMMDDFIPIDTVSAGKVYEDDVYDADVYTVSGAFGFEIPFEVITGVTDGGSQRRKFMGDLWLIHTPVDAAGETVTIETADEQNRVYSGTRLLDVSDSEDRINRMGSFRRRNFRLSGTLSSQIRMESLAATVRIGQQ